MRVVVGASTFAEAGEDALRKLEENGIEVVKNPYRRKMTEAEIIEHLRGADGLLAGLEPINESVLAASPGLKAIARIGIGMDSVDQEACKRHGVKVSITPDAPTKAVAEMAFAALLTINRRIIPCNDDMHHGEWNKRLGAAVSGQTVLIVGYGRIGKQFSEYVRVLGGKVIIYDPYQSEISESDLQSAVKKADVISLNAAGQEQILTKKVFEDMKDGVIILNCARGNLLDEDALYDGLQSGHVGYFWGDVYSTEPYTGKLTECENAILTPHISSNTKECRLAMELEATENLLRDLG